MNNLEKEQELLNEKKLQNTIKYGENPMDKVKQLKVVQAMLTNGLKWDSLSEDAKEGLGGKLRFATNVLNKANIKTQSGRDKLIQSLGLDINREISPTYRTMYGAKNTLQEMKAGVTDLFTSDAYKEKALKDPTQQPKADARQSYIEREIRSKAFEAYGGSSDLMSDVGEALPYVGVGGATGLATKGLGIGAAILVDLVTQGAATSAEYLGASDHDRQSGQQAAMDTGANIAGMLLGRYALPAGIEFTNKQLDKFADFLNNPKYTQEQLTEISGSVKDMANALDIKLFNLDGTMSKDSIANFKKQIGDLSSAEQYKLGTATAEDMNKFLDYYQQASDNLVSVSGDAGATAGRVGNELAAVKEHMGQNVRDLYKVSDETLKASANTVNRDELFNGILRNTETRVDVRQEVDAFLDKLYKDSDTDISASGVNDLIKIFKAKARDEGSKQGGATAASAYNSIIANLEKQLEATLPNTKPLKAANSAYREKLGLFGYNDTGKGANNDNFIPKFIKQLQSDPAKALNQVNTADRITTLKGVLSPEAFASIGKNKLESAIAKATTNGEISLTKLSKELRNMPADIKKALFGDNTGKIDGIMEMAEVLGKRQSAGKAVDNKSLVDLFVNSNLRGSLGSWLPSKMAISAALDFTKGKTLREAMPVIMDELSKSKTLIQDMSPLPFNQATGQIVGEEFQTLKSKPLR